MERWFRDLRDRRIRRGSFKTVPELIAVITDDLQQFTQSPHVVVWTASAESSWAKVASKCEEGLETLHLTGSLLTNPRDARILCH